MKDLKRILAPTDLSERSRPGVRCALETAAARNAEVIVYYVVGREEAGGYEDAALRGAICSKSYRRAQSLIAAHRELLHGFLVRNFADLLGQVVIREEVEIGDPYRRIVEKAAEEGVGLIVIATHGRTGLSHVPLGSVAKRVLRHAPCPVLSVRTKKPARTAAAAVG